MSTVLALSLRRSSIFNHNGGFTSYRYKDTLGCEFKNGVVGMKPGQGITRLKEISSA